MVVVRNLNPGVNGEWPKSDQFVRQINVFNSTDLFYFIFHF